MFDAKTIRLAESLRPDLDFSVMGTEQFAILKIVENASGGGVVPVYDADITNGIASFGGVTKSKPLVSLKLNLPVTQTGSGTPSPDNIRDFIPVSGVTIGQISNGQYASAFKGLLAGTHSFVDLGDLDWSYSGSGDNRYFASSIIARMVADANLQRVVTICEKYLGVTPRVTTNLADKQVCKTVNAQRIIFIKDSDYTDATAFKSAMNGVMLIYELAEPSTPVTPQEFAMLCQAFGITGNTYQITFGQTVYSANLDVLTGKLSVTHELKTIDENSDIQVASGIFFINEFFEIEEDAITDSYECNFYQRAANRRSPSNVMNNNPDYSFCCNISSSTPKRIFIKDTRFTTLEDYKTWLSTNPVKIAVKLAEPIEVDITPTQITTLIGENVIFADVADVTECKYTRK